MADKSQSVGQYVRHHFQKCLFLHVQYPGVLKLKGDQQFFQLSEVVCTTGINVAICFKTNAYSCGCKL